MKPLVTKNHRNYLISIIIPSYNRGRLIAETINSVLNQSYEKWELLIVDDGSKDNTDQVINSFLKDHRIRYVKRPKNRPGGGNAARNYGFEISRGEYIKWLDSDDLLAPHCLEKQMELMQEGGYDVVFSRSRFFSKKDEYGNFTWDKYWSESFPKDNPFENYLFGKIRFSTADALWSVKFIGEASPFKEDLKNSQEWLMYITQLVKNPTYLIDGEVLVYSRMHSGQMHNKKRLSLHYRHQMLARYFAIRSLKKEGKLNYLRFKYLYKNMALNFIAPIRKYKFKFLFTNLVILLGTLFLYLGTFLKKSVYE